MKINMKSCKRWIPQRNIQPDFVSFTTDIHHQNRSQLDFLDCKIIQSNKNIKKNGSYQTNKGFVQFQVTFLLGQILKFIDGKILHLKSSNRCWNNQSEYQGSVPGTHNFDFRWLIIQFVCQNNTDKVVVWPKCC